MKKRFLLSAVVIAAAVLGLTGCTTLTNASAGVNGAVLLDAPAQAVAVEHNVIFDVGEQRMTVGYELRNPSSRDIPVHLAFPLGFTQEDFNSDGIAVTDNAAISVDGQPFGFTVRYTYTWAGDKFSVMEEAQKLSDGYKSDGALAYDAPVTQYTYEIIDPNHAVYGLSLEALPLSPDHAVILPAVGWNMANGKPTFRGGDSQFSVYVIGELSEEENAYLLNPVWEATDGYGEEPTEVDCIFKESATCTFKEFALTYYEYDISKSEAENAVLQVDWYNAALEQLQQARVGIDGVSYYFSDVNIGHCLMGWNDIRAVLPANGGLAASFTTPLQTYVKTHKDNPATCEYRYSFEALDSWGGGIDVNVDIRTDKKIIENTYGNFTKTDGGYHAVLSAQEREKGALVLTLAPQNYVKPMDPVVRFRLILGMILLGLVLVIALLVVAIVLLRRRNKS